MDFTRVRNNISFRQLIVIGTLVLVSFCYCRGAEKIAHFYFNSEAGLKAMGITSPKDGFVLTNDTCTAEDISLRFTKGDLDPSIIKSSYYFLRLVKNCTMTVSAGEGVNITSIVINGTSPEKLTVDKGSFSEGTWTGSAGSVLFTVSTGSVQINYLNIYYDDGAGEEVVRGVFSLVTSDDQLKIGNRYIIVNADKTHLAGTFANNKLAGVTTGFTMDNTNDQITVTGNDIEIITFEESTTNGFFLLRNSRGSYYNVDSPGNSKLTEVTDGSRVSVKLKNGLAHLAYQPGASRSLRFVSDNAYF